MGRQVTVHDPHSSQRALVYEQSKEDIRFRRRIALRRWIRSCLCLCAAFLVLILVLVCLGSIIWVTLRPKAPHLSLQGITLHDLKVLEANGTTAVGNKTRSVGNHTVMYLNSTLFIMATNTNRVSVSYSTVHLNITYNDLALDDVSMPPFRVQAHGNLSVATPFAVSYMGFYQTDGQELLRDAKTNHLPIRLVGHTTAKMFTVGFKSLIQLNMACDIVIQYQDLKVQSNVCQTTSSKL